MDAPSTPSPAGHGYQLPIVDCDVLEAAKENIQPLAAGRRATSLEHILSTPHKQRDARLTQERARFRAEISAALQEDDDPLAAYDQFVKWTLESYPQGHSAESGLLELLEEATRVFKDDLSYKGDLRYLKLWSLYASHVEKQAAIYAFLLANEIGTTYAHLYEEYATVLERDGRRADADEIYMLGINRKARPIDRLKSRHREFQKRMMAASALPATTTSVPTAAPSAAKKRTVLGATSAISPPVVSGSSAPRPNGRMPVFVDEDGPSNAEGNEWPDVGTRKSRIKENVKEVSRAGDSTLKQIRPGPPPNTPKIVPYRDEVLEPTTPSTRPREDVMVQSKGITEAESIRRDPLRGHTVATSKSMAPPKHPAPTHAPTYTQLPFDPYAHMLSAPQAPAPGRRAEKFRFDLDQLFRRDEDNGRGGYGVEYSMQEARARSMGLLGKKWGPPPASEMASGSKNNSTISKGEQSVRVNFNDDGRKNGTRSFTAMIGAVGGAGEPTVTLNTKEALRDVFGMFNSPEKSRRVGPAIAGSKHAPVRKVEPATPVAVAAPAQAPNNENAGLLSKTPVAAFRPFVDESAGRLSNSTSGFKPFVDENPNKTPFTPDVRSRPALGAKDPVAPATVSNTKNVLGTKPTSLLSVAETHDIVVSKTFMPAAPKEKLPRDVFIDEHDSANSESRPEVVNVFRSSVTRTEENTAVPRAKFVPFTDEETPFKVFSRPTEDKFAPKSSTSRPLGELAARPVLSLDIGVRSEVLASAHADEESDEEEEENTEQDLDDSEVAMRTPLPEEDYEDEDEAYRAPLGRFGEFNVMTPITERTFEFTSSTRLAETPNDHPSTIDKGFVQHDAVEAAEKLAAELREEEEREQALARGEQDRHRSLLLPPSLLGRKACDSDDSPFTSFDKSGSPPFRLSDGYTIPLAQAIDHRSLTPTIVDKTTTLSLSDTLSLASAFSPPNPCNPFDPPIVTTLLSLLPPDALHYDLRGEISNLLADLQKFSRKRDRRASGNTSSSSAIDQLDVFPLRLRGREFRVIRKLGEGAFGAVFEAKDMGASTQTNDDDEEDDDEDDGASSVALKVVKPRNLWEYHVLRRIHSTLSPRLRASVIQPRELYAYRDESFLVMDLCRQGTLLDIVNRAGQAGVSQQGACLDELLVVFFAIELLRLVEGMHAAGFIHGDLKIDNCLVRLEDVQGGALAWTSVYQPLGEGGWSSKGIKMVDFGRTIDTRVFPSTQKFIAEWEVNGRDCPEIQEGRPWTFQTDYYGLAGIIYCMLFGKYMEGSAVVLMSPNDSPRIKLSTQFKRYWQVDLWTRLFDTLLNSCLVRPDQRLPICAELRELREEMETWLRTNCNRSTNSLKGLLKKVEVATLVG